MGRIVGLEPISDADLQDHYVNTGNSTIDEINTMNVSQNWQQGFGSTFLPLLDNILASAHNSSQCPDAKLATRRRARPPSCRHQDSRYAGEEVFT